MDQTDNPKAEGSAPACGVAAVCLLGLLAWQAWTTLTLFESLDGLLDDRPVVSGKHARHLYLGTIGAPALATYGSGCGYDPAIQIGIPKSPIFSGGRFAELCLYLGGSEYQPAAYKIGVASLCMLVPLFLLGAAWGVGLSPMGLVFAVASGLLVFWSGPSRGAIEAADYESSLAALALLMHVGMLVRFDRHPGLTVWLALVLSGVIGWFAQPLLYPALLPLFLVYYLSTGPRHRDAAWHLALWASEILGLILNAWWLWDWAWFWSVRTPVPCPGFVAEPQTLHTLWNASLWGGPADRVLALALLASALIGICFLNQARQRPAARLLGMGAGGLVTFALLGLSWERLGQLGDLLVPALFFAAVPAAHAWTQLFAGLRHLLQSGLHAALVCLALGASVFMAFPGCLSVLAERCVGTTPLPMGLRPEQTDVVEKLIRLTGPEARTLWEDRPGSGPGWTPLLPLLTGRTFIGGFDAERTCEHTRIGLVSGELSGLPLAQWPDTSLEAYCRRYAVGWIVCWSPATLERLKKWKDATLIAELHDCGTGYLFRVRPETRSLILKGQAEIVHADSHHITLADVVPDNGVVVLSLHYQRQLVATPSRVQIEREEDASDPIGFLRLRMSGPVARVTLTWRGR
jgi:hypothetical protein